MQKMKQITPRDTDFSQWYTDVVKNSGLIDYGPVKGTIIFKPYGYAIWENIQSILDKEFKSKNSLNVYFPMLIPKSLFNKEKEHISGFAPELATVTKIGDKVLSDELYIRPTSEVLMATQFAKEIQSYKELPLIYNQWTSVIRWEKTTRPFLRSSEFLWQEGHSVHASNIEAKNMTLEILNIYKKIATDVLLLPVISGKKTEKEKFAGAQETYTIESLMYDGQSLQAGTSHYFGDNFSKTFNIKFKNKNQEEEFGYTTSWGVSTRLIGAIIMTHSDDQGLVLPSKIAPTQIQIININDSDEVIRAAKKIQEKLSNFYRVNIDNSDKSFGFKISNAEIKGIPIRVEIGPRDLAENSVIISRRDIRSKEKIQIENILEYVHDQIKKYDKNIYQNALNNRKQRTFSASSLEEYVDLLNKKQGYVLVPFCCEISCEEDIKQKTQTNSRCIPDDIKQEKSLCFNCKKASKNLVYFARAY